MVCLIEGRKNTGSYPNPSSPRGSYCIIPEIDPTTDAMRTDLDSWLGYSVGLIWWVLLPAIAITHLNRAVLSGHLTVSRFFKSKDTRASSDVKHAPP